MRPRLLLRLSSDQPLQKMKQNGKPRSFVLRIAIGVAGWYGILSHHIIGESIWAWVGVAAGMCGIWWAFPRNEAEAKQVRFPSDDRFEYYQRVLAGDAARERCACCGYPTLDEFSPSDCFLCEWDPTEGVLLEEARENFNRYGTIYSSGQRPAWNPSSPSAEEYAAAEALVLLYRQHSAAESDEKLDVWLEVIEAEIALHRVRERRISKL